MNAALEGLAANLDNAIGGYLGRLSKEVASGEAGGIVVTVQLDGDIVDIDVPDHALRRGTARGFGDVILAAIQRAHANAAVRREELADAVTVLGEPVMELARQMQEDPEGTLDRLNRPRW